MPDIFLRLFEDTFAASDDLTYLPARPRALYLVEGSVWIETPADAQRLTAGSGRVEASRLAIGAQAGNTRMWRWELGGERESEVRLRSTPRSDTRLLIEQRLDLPEGFEWLMRCDRVAIPAGQVAYTHVHQGPGVRCTLNGSFRVETQGTAHVHRVGDAWFETGIDPVTAFAADDVDSDFARCMILPASCKGRSSVRYVNDADLGKPKPQSYTVFSERLVTLPGA